MNRSGKETSSERKGVALVIALVFAVLLLQMAVAYTNILKTAQPQTEILDESIKLSFLADGLAQKAILKFQLFPGDFYAAWDAASISNNQQFVRDFWDQADLKNQNCAEANSSFASFPITVEISSMSLLTIPNWKKEALRVQAIANFTNKKNIDKDKIVVRVFSTARETNTITSP